MLKIYGRNAVYEALKSRDREIIKLMLKQNIVGEKIREIVELAADRKVKIEYVEGKSFDSRFPVRAQGVVLVAGKKTFFTLSEVLDSAKANNDPPFIVLIDRVQDVRNLGSIIRTAAAFGINGIIIPKYGSAQISEEVERISQGTVNYMMICETSNLRNDIGFLKDRCVKIVSLDMAGGTSLNDFSMPPEGIALILGNEGKGIKDILREESDIVLNIPMNEGVESLNVSVSFAVVAYKLRRL